MRRELSTEVVLVANALGILACASIIWDLTPAYLFNHGDSITGLPSWLGVNTLLLIFDLSNYKEQIEPKRIFKGALLCPFWLLLRWIVI